jgi:predicted DNA-binding protein (UPF0278 family)
MAESQLYNLLALKQELKNCQSLTLKDKQKLMDKIDYVLLKHSVSIRPNALLENTDFLEPVKSKDELMRDVMTQAVKRKVKLKSDLKPILNSTEFSVLSIDEVWDNYQIVLDRLIEHDALIIVNDLKFQAQVQKQIPEEYGRMDIEKTVRRLRPDLRSAVRERVIDMIWKGEL